MAETLARHQAPRSTDACHGQPRRHPTTIQALVILLTAALTACQVNPTRTTSPSVAVVNESEATPLRQNIAQTLANTTPRDVYPGLLSSGLISQGDLWEQMRDGFALPGCDYTPGIQYWIGRYAASPRRFASTLTDMLPAIDYTHRQMRDAGLPSEFALLPIVESHYRPYPGPESRPAGMWQMVGSTARSTGLTVDSSFDGRLNLAASTESAIALLNRYGDHFNSDWRLVAFAYNAGEHRVKRALEKHEPSQSFDSLRGLGLSDISYEYLTKLLALSCLIREPERYQLELPKLPEEQRLVRLDLEGTVGRNLLRALSGMDDDEFARYNSGLLRNHSNTVKSLPLLATNETADRIEGVVDQLPDRYRTGWQQRRLREGETIEELASTYDLPSELLYAINRHEPEPSSSLVWLPGRSGGNPSVSAPAPEPRTSGAATTHTVRSGDNAWTIARRNGLTVQQLLRYNGMDNPRLKPGQRLRLTPP